MDPFSKKRDFRCVIYTPIIYGSESGELSAAEVDRMMGSKATALGQHLATRIPIDFPNISVLRLTQTSAEAAAICNNPSDFKSTFFDRADYIILVVSEETVEALQTFYTIRLADYLAEDYMNSCKRFVLVTPGRVKLPPDINLSQMKNKTVIFAQTDWKTDMIKMLFLYKIIKEPLQNEDKQSSTYESETLAIIQNSPIEVQQDNITSTLSNARSTTHSLYKNKDGTGHVTVTSSVQREIETTETSHLHCQPFHSPSLARRLKDGRNTPEVGRSSPFWHKSFERLHSNKTTSEDDGMSNCSNQSNSRPYASFMRRVPSESYDDSNDDITSCHLEARPASTRPKLLGKIVLTSSSSENKLSPKEVITHETTVTHRLGMSPITTTKMNIPKLATPNQLEERKLYTPSFESDPKNISASTEKVKYKTFNSAAARLALSRSRSSKSSASKDKPPEVDKKKTLVETAEQEQITEKRARLESNEVEERKTNVCDVRNSELESQPMSFTGNIVSSSDLTARAGSAWSRPLGGLQIKSGPLSIDSTEVLAAETCKVDEEPMETLDGDPKQIILKPIDELDIKTDPTTDVSTIQECSMQKEESDNVSSVYLTEYAECINTEHQILTENFGTTEVFETAGINISQAESDQLPSIAGGETISEDSEKIMESESMDLQINSHKRLVEMDQKNEEAKKSKLDESFQLGSADVSLNEKEQYQIEDDSSANITFPLLDPNIKSSDTEESVIFPGEASSFNKMLEMSSDPILIDRDEKKEGTIILVSEEIQLLQDPSNVDTVLSPCTRENDYEAVMNKVDEKTIETAANTEHNYKGLSLHEREQSVQCKNRCETPTDHIIKHATDVSNDLIQNASQRTNEIITRARISSEYVIQHATKVSSDVIQNAVTEQELSNTKQLQRHSSNEKYKTNSNMESIESAIKNSNDVICHATTSSDGIVKHASEKSDEVVRRAMMRSGISTQNALGKSKSFSELPKLFKQSSHVKTDDKSEENSIFAEGTKHSASSSNAEIMERAVQTSNEVILRALNRSKSLIDHATSISEGIIHHATSPKTKSESAEFFEEKETKEFVETNSSSNLSEIETGEVTKVSELVVKQEPTYNVNVDTLPQYIVDIIQQLDSIEKSNTIPDSDSAIPGQIPETNTEYQIQEFDTTDYTDDNNHQTVLNSFESATPELNHEAIIQHAELKVNEDMTEECLIEIEEIVDEHIESENVADIFQMNALKFSIAHSNASEVTENVNQDSLLDVEEIAIEIIVAEVTECISYDIAVEFESVIDQKIEPEVIKAFNQEELKIEKRVVQHSVQDIVDSVTEEIEFNNNAMHIVTTEITENMDEEILQFQDVSIQQSHPEIIDSVTQAANIESNILQHSLPEIIPCINEDSLLCLDDISILHSVPEIVEDVSQDNVVQFEVLHQHVAPKIIKSVTHEPDIISDVVQHTVPAIVDTVPQEMVLEFDEDVEHNLMPEDITCEKQEFGIESNVFQHTLLESNEGIVQDYLFEFENDTTQHNVAEVVECVELENVVEIDIHEILGISEKVAECTELLSQENSIQHTSVEVIETIIKDSIVQLEGETEAQTVENTVEMEPDVIHYLPNVEIICDSQEHVFKFKEDDILYNSLDTVEEVSEDKDENKITVTEVIERETDNAALKPYVIPEIIENPATQFNNESDYVTIVPEIPKDITQNIALKTTAESAQDESELEPTVLEYGTPRINECDSQDYIFEFVESITDDADLDHTAAEDKQQSLQTMKESTTIQLCDELQNATGSTEKERVERILLELENPGTPDDDDTSDSEDEDAEGLFSEDFFEALKELDKVILDKNDFSEASSEAEQSRKVSRDEGKPETDIQEEVSEEFNWLLNSKDPRKRVKRQKNRIPNFDSNFANSNDVDSYNSNTAAQDSGLFIEDTLDNVDNQTDNTETETKIELQRETDNDVHLEPNEVFKEIEGVLFDSNDPTEKALEQMLDQQESHGSASNISFDQAPDFEQTEHLEWDVTQFTELLNPKDPRKRVKRPKKRISYLDSNLFHQSSENIDIITEETTALECSDKDDHSESFEEIKNSGIFSKNRKDNSLAETSLVADQVHIDRKPKDSNLSEPQQTLSSEGSDNVTDINKQEIVIYKTNEPINENSSMEVNSPELNSRSKEKDLVQVTAPEKSAVVIPPPFEYTILEKDPSSLRDEVIEDETQILSNDSPLLVEKSSTVFGSESHEEEHFITAEHIEPTDSESDSYSNLEYATACSNMESDTQSFYSADGGISNSDSDCDIVNPKKLQTQQSSKIVELWDSTSFGSYTEVPHGSADAEEDVKSSDNNESERLVGIALTQVISQGEQFTLFASRGTLVIPQISRPSNKVTYSNKQTMVTELELQLPLDSSDSDNTIDSDENVCSSEEVDDNVDGNNFEPDKKILERHVEDLLSAKSVGQLKMAQSERFTSLQAAVQSESDSSNDGSKKTKKGGFSENFWKFWIPSGASLVVAIALGFTIYKKYIS